LHRLLLCLNIYIFHLRRCCGGPLPFALSLGAPSSYPHVLVASLSPVEDCDGNERRFLCRTTDLLRSLKASPSTARVGEDTSTTLSPTCRPLLQYHVLLVGGVCHDVWLDSSSRRTLPSASFSKFKIQEVVSSAFVFPEKQNFARQPQGRDPCTLRAPPLSS